MGFNIELSSILSKKCNYVSNQNRKEIFRATYSLVEQYLWKWSKIFIVGPHLSGLLFSGHIVTVGKATFSIGYDIVSIIVIVGFSLHAEMWEKMMKRLVFVKTNLKTYILQHFLFGDPHT